MTSFDYFRSQTNTHEGPLIDSVGTLLYPQTPVEFYDCSVIMTVLGMIGKCE